MFLLLFLAFTLIPLAELALLIKAGSWLGLWPTLGIVVLTGALGAFLARMEGLRVLRRMQEEMARGIAPAARLFDGVCILLAGIMLITPGFLTDAAGLLLLLPPVRRTLLWWFKRRMRRYNAVVWMNGPEEEDETFPP